MHAAQLGKPQLITPEELRALIQRHAPAEIIRVYGDAFVVEEFNEIVDAFGLRDWDSYRDVRRLGRKSRLNEAKRRLLWEGFAAVLQELERSGQITSHQLFHRTAEQLHRSCARPYQHIVVDECQDITAGQLRLLAALAGTSTDSLFFAGDLGQRIFQQPFSWTQYGVDIRGRSRTLRINYRTSHQIRSQADQLLDPESSTDRSLPSGNARTPTAKPSRSLPGLSSGAARASPPGSSASSYAASQRSPVPRLLCSWRSCPTSDCSFRPCASAARPPSPPCTWPRDWSSAP
ncbi:MAG: AAA family ATPase [Cyanobacteria bacterium]|nr:AAA family ATPase [Cyanobacteriota bacterium]